MFVCYIILIVCQRSRDIFFSFYLVYDYMFGCLHFRNLKFLFELYYFQNVIEKNLNFNLTKDENTFVTLIIHIDGITLTF